MKATSGSHSRTASLDAGCGCQGQRIVRLQNSQVNNDTTNRTPAVIELVTVTGRPARPTSSAPSGSFSAGPMESAITLPRRLTHMRREARAPRAGAPVASVMKYWRGATTAIHQQSEGHERERVEHREERVEEADCPVLHHLTEVEGRFARDGEPSGRVVAGIGRDDRRVAVEVDGERDQRERQCELGPVVEVPAEVVAVEELEDDVVRGNERHDRCKGDERMEALPILLANLPDDLRLISADPWIFGHARRVTGETDATVTPTRMRS